MRTIITVLLIASVMFHGATAYADVLILKNGDQITGDVKKIWDGEITVDTEYADEIRIDLVAVESIKSDREFEIELADGRKFVGSITASESGGYFEIKSDDDTVVVPLSDLYELDEPRKTTDWSSNLELLASLNSGNTESYNTKLRADTSFRHNDHRHIGEATLHREELSGVLAQDQDLFSYNYNWLFRDPWFVNARVSYERNSIIALDQRMIYSVGVGRDIWASPRRNLSVQFGVGTQTEEAGLQTTSNGVLTWTLRYRQDFLKEDLELYHNQTIIYNTSGRDNTSYKTTTGLRYQISELLYGNISVDYDYETAPVELAENEDVALLVGLGVEF